MAKKRGEYEGENEDDFSGDVAQYDTQAMRQVRDRFAPNSAPQNIEMPFGFDAPQRQVAPEEAVPAELAPPPPPGGGRWFHNAFTNIQGQFPAFNARQPEQQFPERIDPTKMPLIGSNRTGQRAKWAELPDVSGLSGEMKPLPPSNQFTQPANDLDAWNQLHNRARFDPEAARELELMRNFRKAEYQQMGAAAEQEFKRQQADAAQKAILNRQKELVGVRGAEKVNVHGQIMDQDQQRAIDELERKKREIDAADGFSDDEKKLLKLQVDTKINTVMQQKSLQKSKEVHPSGHAHGESWTDDQGRTWTINHAGDQVPLVHPMDKPPKGDHHQEKQDSADYAEAYKELTHQEADAQGNLRKVHPTGDEVRAYIMNKRQILAELKGGGTKPQAPAPQPTPAMQQAPQQAPMAPSKLPQVNSKEDLARIPSGAVFIGPDGQQRVKH